MRPGDECLAWVICLYLGLAEKSSTQAWRGRLCSRPMEHSSASEHIRSNGRLRVRALTQCRLWRKIPSGSCWPPAVSQEFGATGRCRCIGADQARKIGSVDPMAANGKPSKKIIFSGGVVAMSGIGREPRYTKGRFGAAKYQRPLSGNELVAVTDSSVPTRAIRQLKNGALKQPSNTAHCAAPQAASHNS